MEQVSVPLLITTDRPVCVFVLFFEEACVTKLRNVWFTFRCGSSSQKFQIVVENSAMWIPVFPWVFVSWQSSDKSFPVEETKKVFKATPTHSTVPTYTSLSLFLFLSSSLFGLFWVLKTTILFFFSSSPFLRAVVHSKNVSDVRCWLKRLHLKFPQHHQTENKEETKKISIWWMSKFPTDTNQIPFEWSNITFCNCNRN